MGEILANVPIEAQFWLEGLYGKELDGATMLKAVRFPYFGKSELKFLHSSATSSVEANVAAVVAYAQKMSAAAAQAPTSAAVLAAASDSAISIVEDDRGVLGRDLLERCGLWSCSVDLFRKENPTNSLVQKFAQVLVAEPFASLFHGEKVDDVLAMFKAFKAVMFGRNASVGPYTATDAGVDLLRAATSIALPQQEVTLTNYNLLEFVSQFDFSTRKIEVVPASGKAKAKVTIEYSLGSEAIVFENGMPVSPMTAINAYLESWGTMSAVKFAYEHVPSEVYTVANYMVCSRNFHFDSQKKTFAIAGNKPGFEFLGPIFASVAQDGLVEKLRARLRSRAQEMYSKGFKVHDTRSQYYCILIALNRLYAEKREGDFEAIQLVHKKVSIVGAQSLRSALKAIPTALVHERGHTPRDITDELARGRKIRNNLPREEITKNDGVLQVFQHLPNQFEVAYKFKQLTDWLEPSESKLPVDFYGTAANGWLEVLDAKFGVRDSKVAHHFYDIAPECVDKAVGNTAYRVEKRSVYEIPPNVGGGRGCISDAASKNTMNYAETKELIDCVVRANYDWVVVKLFFADGQQDDSAGSWLRMLSAKYNTVKFMKPGKLQNAEFFVLASNRRDGGQSTLNGPTGSLTLFNGLIARSYPTVKAMNDYMNAVTQVGFAEACPYTDVWFALLKVDPPSAAMVFHEGKPLSRGYISPRNAGSTKRAVVSISGDEMTDAPF